MNAHSRTATPGDLITMAHGGGGKAMRDLISRIFTDVFQPESREDQARLSAAALQEPGARLAMTTDSFVVHPLEFPGGDIGKLAVCGTINDLAVGGARPLWLSAAFILEEGTEIALLQRIVNTMQREARAAGVRIVTGDTKVVERGAADQVFITTTGVGVIPPERDPGAHNIQPGDAILVNGEIGNHGAAILAARGDMALSADIRSDCQSLNHLMETVFTAAPDTRAARDATRGGLASTLNELAMDAGCSMELTEEHIPLHPEVRGICEILGLDPLYLANEGTLALILPESSAPAALAAMQAHPAGRGARQIGVVTPGTTTPRVSMHTPFGGQRIVDMLVGEQLPRIC